MRAFLSLSVLATLVAGRGLAAETVRVAPPPPWAIVRAAEDLPLTPEADRSYGRDYLILDMQVLVREQATYTHDVYRVTNDGALQSAARLMLEFDPAYEELTLHHLRVIRDGRAEDRLATTPVTVIRQERDLDRHMLNGRLTALVVLEDIRVGDVIDFACTRRGWNPVFAGRYSSWVTTGWPVPVRWRNFRLVAPADRVPAAMSHGPRACKPVRKSAGDDDVLTWTETGVVPVVAESGTPGWHESFPSIQLTGFPTWAEVVRWAEPLYAVPDPLPETVRAEAGRLTAGAASDEARALALLRFVQQEIRYLGMELGAGSYRPSPPDVVLARRFGDCKDKVLLFRALASAAGLTVYPAFVHTDFRDRVEAWLPTPEAFDHVIAVLAQPGGTERWLDPTLGYQQGGLETRGLPDYRRALVVRAGSDRFSAVLVPPGARSTTRVDEEFESPAFDQPAKFRVKTLVTGLAADRMRAEFAHNTPEEISKAYVNYYAAAMPGLTALQLPRLTEDPARNVVTVEESYSVPDLWTTGDGGQLAAEFVPKPILDRAARPAATVRSTPLAVHYPDFIEVTTTVRLPEEWTITPATQTMESDAFRGTINMTGAGNEVVIKHSWESRSDHVKPERVAQHVAALAKFREAVGCTLSYTPPTAGDGAAAERGFRLNWMLVLVTLVTVSTGIVAVRFVQARAPALPQLLDEPGPAPLIGLRGWLVLVGFGLVVSPFRLLVTGVTSFRDSFSQDLWEAMTIPGGENYEEWLGAVIVGELVGNVLLLVLVVWTAVLFFRRHRIFPRAYIVLSVFALVLMVADTLAISHLIPPESGDMTDSYRGLAQSIGQAVIWIPYMLVSRRVRHTFTR